MKPVKRGKRWNVRVYDYTDADGKVHMKSFTADTKAQAEYLAAQYKLTKTDKTREKDMTVGQAIDKYLVLRPMLSPTTMTGYERMRKYGFQDIMDLPVSKLDDIVLQEAVNRESMRISERTGKPISVKTLKNEYGLLVSALKTVCKKTYIISLPKKQKHTKEYPEIPDVIAALQGTDVELPCMLALLLTFRMSEIRGLMCSDYEDGYIQIKRVMVDTNRGTIVKDDAKTQGSLRKRKVSPYLHQLITSTESWKRWEDGEDGFLITMSRDKIVRHWIHICEQNGWGLTFHDLRHLAASGMIIAGIPLRYAMDFGGWENNDTLEKTYQHVLTDERDRYEDLISAYFDQYLSRNLSNDL